MSQFSGRNLLLRLEDWRLRQHFKHVETTLRARDVSHLSPALRQSREHALDRLHSYAERSIFPRNYERPIYSPCSQSMPWCSQNGAMPSRRSSR